MWLPFIIGMASILIPVSVLVWKMLEQEKVMSDPNTALPVPDVSDPVRTDDPPMPEGFEGNAPTSEIVPTADEDVTPDGGTPDAA